MNLIGGLVGFVMVFIAAACGIGLLILIPVLFVLMPVPCLIATAIAAARYRNYRQRCRAQDSERDELRQIIAADKARQAVKDELVWGPIRRGVTAEQQRYDRLPDSLA